VYRVDERLCVVRLLPTLSSFTFGRHETVEGTAELRLDFFEAAAAQLEGAGIPCAFRERIDPTTYLADFCEYLPFETIVKNVATGSTLRKYPGLFAEWHPFDPPVVKFDFRTDPEDQPLPDDYVRALGHDPAEQKRLALEVNAVLRDWLAPLRVLDFCLIFGIDGHGRYVVASEVSPDAMRIRDSEDRSFDKDLFRHGADTHELLRTWGELVARAAPARG